MEVSSCYVFHKLLSIWQEEKPPQGLMPSVVSKNHHKPREPKLLFEDLHDSIGRHFDFVIWWTWIQDHCDDKVLFTQAMTLPDFLSTRCSLIIKDLENIAVFLLASLTYETVPVQIPNFKFIVQAPGVQPNSDIRKIIGAPKEKGETLGKQKATQQIK